MRLIKPAEKERLNLDALHLLLGGKLYRGRPQMLLITMNNGRNIQIFQGGSVQILGRISQQQAEGMRAELIQRLTHDDPSCQRLCSILKTNPLSIANMVIHTQLDMNVCLKAIVESDCTLFYEIELFPAALIQKWSPAHVAVFHNGKVIITGVKSYDHCNELLTSLEEYFRSIK